MPLLLWDASALVKRYWPESGSDTVDSLFAHVPSEYRVLPLYGYAEAFRALLEKHLHGDMDGIAFNLATSALRNETIDDPAVRILPISDRVILGSLPLMHAHGLRTADAVILAAFLDFERAHPPGEPVCVLVCSDIRFLQAAAAEGLRSINPQTLPAADVPAFLAAL